MQRCSLLVIGVFGGLLCSLTVGQSLGDAAPRKSVLVPGPGYRAQVTSAATAVDVLKKEHLIRPKGIYTRVAERLRPSVVSIEVQLGRSAASGTGVIVDRDGGILTNFHVIDAADRIDVVLSSFDRYEARVEGFDRATDLALLRIDGLTGLEPATFADSDALDVGEEVIAMGNALGLGWTVSRGIISSMHRSNEIQRADAKGLYKDYIQTDAAINQGDSGGPLVNLAGDVVGINVATMDAHGIGFAIPANDAKFVADSLLKRGEVTRGYLGFAGGSPHELTNEQRRRFGVAATNGFVLVREVSTNSPAHGAGLLVGDVITALDKRPVDDYDALRNRIARLVPGAVVNISIIRDGVKRDLPAKVGKLVGGG